MPRPGWSGRKVTNAIAYVTTRDHGICHLCHHPGANSCDHVIPVNIDPTREWDPTNWAAAHLHQAGQPKGCQTTGCNCIGNVARGTAPLTSSTAPSREW